MIEGKYMDHYKVIRQLGKGFMEKDYLYEDTMSQRHVTPANRRNS